MKRWLGTLGVLLGGIVTGAQADTGYVKIVYQPNVAKGSGTAASAPGTSGSPGSSGSSPGFPSPGAFSVAAPPGDDSDDEDVLYSSIHAEVIVEVKEIKLVPVPQIKTNLGTAWIALPELPGVKIVDLSDIKVVTWPTQTIAQRYKNELGKAGAKSADEWLKLADWALRHGLLKEFESNIEQLGKVDPTHQVVKAIKEQQQAMGREITKGDNAASWKEKLGNYLEKHGAHYNLLFKPEQTSAGDVDRFLNQLETNYKTFFYWFALKGKTLPVPDRRMVVLLVPTANEFKILYKNFDSIPMVGDGFFDRRDALAVLCAEPLDPAYEALNKADLWTSGWDKTKLLMLPDRLGSGAPLGAGPKDFIRAQMMAVLIRGMQEQSAIETVGYEGTRQLMSATGLLPRAVALPDWIQFGIGSFFETPREAYWQGTGAPNVKYLQRFKTLDNKVDKDKPEDALVGIISDGYYRSAVAGKDTKALHKARALAWSLTYYLMQRRLDGMTRYFQELSNLPRDMALDGKVLQGCFARAFGLGEAHKPDEISPAKVKGLANEWYAELKQTPL